MLKINTLSCEELISSIISNENNYCFILGAGASVESGIPLGTTLENRWMKYLTGQEDDLDGTPKILVNYLSNIKSRKTKQKYKQILKIWELNNCTYMPSKYYFDISDIRFNNDRQLSDKYFQHLMADKEPSIGYYLFSKILSEGDRNNIVITTNFDNLISKSINLISSRDHVVLDDEKSILHFHFDYSRPTVIKIHRGLFNTPINSKKDARHLKEEWKELLNKVFEQCIPIVIGYGGGDSSLMDFLTKCTLKKSIYWCYVGDLPDERIINLIKNKEGYLIRIDGFNSFMMNLYKAKYLDEKNFLYDVFSHLYTVSQAQHDYEKAANYYAKMIEFNTQYDEEVLYNNRATIYEKAGNYADALSDYTYAIKIDSSDPKLYNNRGLLYDKIHKYNLALLDFTKAIELNPLADYYNNRGMVYNNIGEYELALKDLNRAIDLCPNDVSYYNNRGYCFSGLNRVEDAFNDYG